MPRQGVDRVRDPLRQLAVDLAEHSVLGARAQARLDAVDRVVVNVDAIGELDRVLEVLHRSLVPTDDLLDGHGVAALHDALGNSGSVDRRLRGPDEEDAHEVAPLLRTRDEVDLLPRREDSLERDTGTLPEERLPTLGGPARGGDHGGGVVPVAEAIARDLVGVEILDAVAPMVLPKP